MLEKVTLPRFHGCFVCGPDNPLGLNLGFVGTDAGVEATWTPADHHIGYAQTVHGGLISAVLDEAVIWAAYHATGRFGVTAELVVRFRRPLMAGRPFGIMARMVQTRGRLWTAEGEIQDEAGAVLASATAKIHPLTEEKSTELRAHWAPN